MARVTAPARRWGRAAAAGVAGLCCGVLAACGHVAAGVPAGSSTWAGKPSVSDSVSNSTSDSASIKPTTSAFAAFCDDVSVNSRFLSQIPTTPQAASIVQSTWDTLAREAPAAIKADLHTIDDGITEISRGHGSSVDAGAFGSALSGVVRWVQMNCATGSSAPS